MVLCLAVYAKLFSSGVIGREEYQLYSRFDKALGIGNGTKVQINGVEVGRISNMKLEANSVVLEITIQKQFQNWITDSAQIFALRDQNLISSRVMNIDIRRSGRVLQDGDTLQSGTAQDLETVIESVNEILYRLNDLIDVAGNVLGLITDSGTTIGALLGSRTLYDNLNLQVGRVDTITSVGTDILIAINEDIPSLLDHSDTVLTDLRRIVGGVQNVPENLDVMFGSMNGFFLQMDTLITNFNGMANVVTGLAEIGGNTLESADEVMSGLSNMWLVRRSIPRADSVPFTVETLW